MARTLSFCGPRGGEAGSRKYHKSVLQVQPVLMVRNRRDGDLCYFNPWMESGRNQGGEREREVSLLFNSAGTELGLMWTQASRATVHYSLFTKVTRKLLCENPRATCVCGVLAVNKAVHMPEPEAMLCNDTRSYLYSETHG